MINEDRNSPDEIAQQVMEGDHWEELLSHIEGGDFMREATFIILESMRKPCNSAKVLEELQTLLDGEIDSFAEEFYE